MAFKAPADQVAMAATLREMHFESLFQLRIIFVPGRGISQELRDLHFHRVGVAQPVSQRLFALASRSGCHSGPPWRA